MFQKLKNDVYEYFCSNPILMYNILNAVHLINVHEILIMIQQKIRTFIIALKIFIAQFIYKFFVVKIRLNKRGLSLTIQLHYPNEKFEFSLSLYSTDKPT